MGAVDFLIVGQGLAGSVLAYQLLKRSKSIVIIDQGSGWTASRQATGLINPITGRRFVKTWLVDDVLPYAEKFYTELSQVLEINCVQKTTIWKVLQNPEQVNDFQARLQEDAYRYYLEKEIIPSKNTITAPYGFAQIHPVLQIDIRQLQDGFLNYFKVKNVLKEETFIHEDLKIEASGYSYKQVKAKRIVFAEGYKIKDNPFFNYLPYSHSKGEALIIKSAALDLEKVLNSKVNFTPLGNHTYYVGATYDWSDKVQKPTEAKRQYLLEGIEASINVPYEVLAQKVGIRPTTKDRRPLIGAHPEYENMYVFNGMGTKGLSLGPYFGKQLVGHIIDKQDLHPEVDIKRIK